MCEKKRLEEEIKITLFKPPERDDREVLEMVEAADALERAMARIPSSSPSVLPPETEVEDALFSNGTKPFARPMNGRGMPKPQLGISLEDLYSHSYTPKPQNTSRWLWIPKARVLEAATKGYPASLEETWRYGGTTRKIAPAEVKLIDSRSFAAVIEMDRWGGGARGGGLPRNFRGREDWRNREVGRKEDDWNRNNNFRRDDGREGGGHQYYGGRNGGRNYKRRMDDSEGYRYRDDDLRNKLNRDQDLRGVGYD